MLATIRPVTLDDVVGLERYEAVRDEVRRRIIRLKRDRRLPVGEIVSLVFENHDTVYFQVQEMLRAERITDLDDIRRELETYNALLPNPGELSATMLIEITERDQIEKRLLSLLGIDETVRMEIGREDAIPADFEPGRSSEDKLSAVQYLRFRVPVRARQAFLDHTVPAWVVIDHPNYQARARVEGGIRASLAEDVDCQ